MCSQSRAEAELRQPAKLGGMPITTTSPRQPRWRPTSGCRPSSPPASRCCTWRSARQASRCCRAWPTGWRPRCASTVTARWPARRRCAPPRRGTSAPRRGDDAGQIVVAPGSKALLFGLLSVLPGDVVLPRPCWVSYAAQAALAGPAGHRRPDPRGGRRRPRPGGAARGARRRACAGRPGHPRAHAARQPDRHGRLALARDRGLRDRARARAADRLRRDLSRPRAPARRAVQPGGAGARTASSSPTA